MLLSITTTHAPATDLGYLLGKHPERLQSFELAYGKAHVFYPETSAERCTACLLLDIDPIGLARDRRDDATLARYVNDRPYVASSFMSVAIARVFASALGGGSRERPELAMAAIPLVVEIAAVPCRGGERFLRALFEPLGYDVATEQALLDDEFPAWGPSPYLRVELRRTARLADVLGHIYVLLPVLDNYKHYWVGQEELEKLLDHGAGWLAAHPARDEIVHRYLKRQRRLTREALARLLADDALEIDDAEERTQHEEQVLEAHAAPADDVVEQRTTARPGEPSQARAVDERTGSQAVTSAPIEVRAGSPEVRASGVDERAGSLVEVRTGGPVDERTVAAVRAGATTVGVSGVANEGVAVVGEQVLEARVSLNDARIAAVCAEIEASGARSVIDLGCGEGRLLARLARRRQLTRLAGTDVSPRALEIARERLPERVGLFQGSLTYRDARFAGFDAACAVEVIEHLEPSRLDAFERVVFELARPATVIVTTPNAELNARFALPAGALRHRDHRFEWTRGELERWAGGVAGRHGYAVRFVPIGEVDAELGAPTQMGVFTR